MTPEKFRELYKKQRRFGKRAHKSSITRVAKLRARSQARFDRLVELIRGGRTKTEAALELGVSKITIEHWCKRHFGSYHYPTPEELDDVV